MVIFDTMASCTYMQTERRIMWMIFFPFELARVLVLGWWLNRL